jgi:hypothetical protein
LPGLTRFPSCIEESFRSSKPASTFEHDQVVRPLIAELKQFGRRLLASQDCRRLLAGQDWCAEHARPRPPSRFYDWARDRLGDAAAGYDYDYDRFRVVWALETGTTQLDAELVRSSARLVASQRPGEIVRA